MHDIRELILERIVYDKFFSSHLRKYHRNGNGQATGLCPFHDDHDPSLSINLADRSKHGAWQCFGCKVSGDVFDFAARLYGTGNKFPETLKQLATDLGITPDAPRSPKRSRRMVTTYPYRDEHGILLFEVVRFDPKGFSQRRPDGRGGWITGEGALTGVRRVLYRLPEVLAEAASGKRIYVPEGEKDVDNLVRFGLTATTNSGGAGKWNRTYTEALRGARVVLLPHNDDGGRSHAQQVAASLHNAGIETRILELDGLPEKGDVSNWLQAGHTAEELEALADKVPIYQPSADPPAGPAPLQYRPFPLDVLPAPVREFVSQSASAIGCDPTYIALPLLAELAAFIGNTRRILLKRTWTEPAVLWTVIIGSSGSQKSPGLEAALAPIKRKQAERLAAHADAMKDYQVKLLHYEVQLSEWRSKGRDKRGEPPEKPLAPAAERYLCSDTTVEALATILADAPLGVLLARDELSGWIDSFDAYRQGRGGDVSHWLSMHRAGDLLVDRKSGDKRTIYVPRAAVSIAGTIQPETLRRALGRKHFENGLAARILMAMPPRRPKKWTEADVEPSVEAAVHTVVDAILRFNFGIGQDGQPVPIDLPLTPEAKVVWVGFYNEHGQHQASLPDGDLAAAFSKLEGYAARLALVVHMVRIAAGEGAPHDTVDKTSIEAGIALARWFAHETERIYSILSETDVERKQRTLVEFIRSKGGSVTIRDLMRGGPYYKKADQAEQALDQLMQDGLGTWETVDTGNVPGPRPQVFRLHDMTNSANGAMGSGS